MKPLFFVTGLSVVCLSFVSCSSSSSKSESSESSAVITTAEVQLPALKEDGVTVFESYSDHQLKQLAKDEPEYLRFYQQIFKVMASAPMEKEQRKAFKDLTYRRLYRYLTLPKNDEFWTPYLAQWEQEWRAIYGYYYYEGADSAAAYWKQVVDDSINCYAQIEPEAILVTGEYDFSLETAYMRFLVTPLKGTITEIFVSYCTGAYADEGHNFNPSTFYAYDPITEPTLTLARLGNPDPWRGVKLEDFLKDHYIKTEIRQVTVDGVNHRYEDLHVPEGIERLILEDIVLHRNQTAKYLNPDFVTLKNFLENKKKETIQLSDPLCYTFVETLATTYIGTLFRSVR